LTPILFFLFLNGSGHTQQGESESGSSFGLGSVDLLTI